MSTKKLPESEFEVMSAIWRLGGEVTSDVIMEQMNKPWKKTTLLSLLTRLCGRGFLQCEKRGKTNFYKSVISEKDYASSESARFLKSVHHNSLTKLVAALYDGKAITKEDLKELEKFISEAK